MKWCWILSKAFSAAIEMIKWFLSLLLLMCYITFIDLCMLNNPDIPGMNPIWSWWVIFMIYCWIWFAILSLFSVLVVLMIICHWEALFWLSLFGVLQVSCSWMGKTFLRFGKFSVIILLNILCMLGIFEISSQELFPRLAPNCDPLDLCLLSS
jgi:hypothetical protein